MPGSTGAFNASHGSSGCRHPASRHPAFPAAPSVFAFPSSVPSAIFHDHASPQGLVPVPGDSARRVASARRGGAGTVAALSHAWRRQSGDRVAPRRADRARDGRNADHNVDIGTGTLGSWSRRGIGDGDLRPFVADARPRSPHVFVHRRLLSCGGCVRRAVGPDGGAPRRFLRGGQLRPGCRVARTARAGLFSSLYDRTAARLSAARLRTMA